MTDTLPPVSTPPTSAADPPPTDVQTPTQGPAPLPYIACWAAKGSAGTTVVTASLALTLATAHPSGAVLADLAGDVPAALGLTEAGSHRTLGACLADQEGAHLFTHIEVDAIPGLALLARGPGRLDPVRGHHLAETFGRSHRPVVVDCGTHPNHASTVIVERAAWSLLVTRPCSLALRHAASASLRPTGVILVREPGRMLGRRDVERAVNAPVLAEVDNDAVVARAVDAGLLTSPQLPRALRNASITLLNRLSEPPSGEQPGDRPANGGDVWGDRS